MRGIGGPKLRWINNVAQDGDCLGKKLDGNLHPLTGTAGKNFYRRPMLIAGCSADDHDETSLISRYSVYT
jgi:hypothetical protein